MTTSKTPGLPFVPRALRYAILPVLVVVIASAPYAALPLEERMRSPMHPWLRASGPVGQSAGILAFLGFAFLWLYPLRKKLRSWSWTGPLAKWLDVHVVVGLLVPILAGIHSSWRFTGLIGLGTVAMFIVSCSGVIGRYLYVRIPRTRTGLEMSRDDVIAERHQLVERIADATGLPRDSIRAMLAPSRLAEDSSLAQAAIGMVRDDFARRRAVRNLVAEWTKSTRGKSRPAREILADVKRLARREMQLSQQIRMLGATLRVFRFWHVAHRPFAMTAFLAVTVHVVVVIALGATWFW
jgi:hypothetical protein